MKHRMFTYRVYFTVDPDRYFVLAAKNARNAVYQAKRSHRASPLTKRRPAPLKVAKVERLYRDRVRKLTVSGM